MFKVSGESVPERKRYGLGPANATVINVQVMDGSFARDKSHRLGGGSSKLIPVVTDAGLRSNDFD